MKFGRYLWHQERARLLVRICTYTYIYVLYTYNDLLQGEDRIRLCQKCIDPAACYACTNIYRRRILLYKAPAEIRSSIAKR